MPENGRKPEADDRGSRAPFPGADQAEVASWRLRHAVVRRRKVDAVNGVFRLRDDAPEPRVVAVASTP